MLCSLRRIALRVTSQRVLGLFRSTAVSASLLAVLAIAISGCPRQDLPSQTKTGASPGEPPPAQAPPTNSLSELVKTRQELDQTVWADEVLAQRYEAPFVKLWDNLRASSDPWKTLSEFQVENFIHGSAGEPQKLEWGIEQVDYAGADHTLTAEQLSALAGKLHDAGYRLVQSEWHHAAFEPAADGQPARSTVNVSLHAANDRTRQRLAFKVKLRVTWKGESGASGPVADTIVADQVQLLRRTGPPVFEEKMSLTPPNLSSNERVDPLIACDLDDNGFSEILAVGRNLALWNVGTDEFRQERISQHLSDVMDTALLADLTGDGLVDLLTIDWDGQLLLLEGDAKGQFPTPPRVSKPGKIELATVITAGDVDEDGDLDLWIGQYRPPYQKGQMPTPYYDANDGFPAYLLLGDGRGNFTDATEAAGLAPKRFRRTYGASLVDLDDDGHLDLLVTSDFSGIDLYRGDGKGKFTEVTDQWVDQRHNFGMSHTFGDYDGDGRLDFYVIGMSSTTARRLDQLGLGRSDYPDIDRMRGTMGYGNRVYLARDGRYVVPDWNDQVARTGWSWGSATLDFDNDGDRDVYVVNGHQSGRSTQDYCTTFWRHDIYTGSSKPDDNVARLFGDTFGAVERGETSWNGYEKNVLWMNRGQAGFVNVAFLLGLAFEFDARALLADDLDGDGRVDLLVQENRRPEPGSMRQALYVLMNRLPTENHWIGVRLVGRPGLSPIGAKVTLHTADGIQPARIVTGDSLYTQHAPVAHFGLGKQTEVEALEIVWADGTKQRLERPEIDHYHRVVAGE